jgi:8-oxo-dGTP pyrophosphatase MutT (NUDIX family)
MDVLESTLNSFGGVVIDPKALSALPEEFRHRLSRSLAQWTSEGLKVAWLEIPISMAALIPIAVEMGFVFHHSTQDYLMLTYRLAAGAFIPPYATHYIGAGGVVLNGQGELLVVTEKFLRGDRPHYYKLPGGALHAGEHIVDGVIREVLEETGIQTRFESLVCFRHWHGYRFGKSDIYFVCRLSPLTTEITIDEQEIDVGMWMPVERYLASESVGIFNKCIVQAALKGNSLVTTWIEGYQTDPNTREIFVPAGFTP